MALPIPTTAPALYPEPRESTAAESATSAPACRRGNRFQRPCSTRAWKPAARPPIQRPVQSIVSNCDSGPMPKGNRLTTMTKKKSVDKTSARRRHANVRSRRRSNETSSTWRARSRASVAAAQRTRGKIQFLVSGDDRHPSAFQMRFDYRRNQTYCRAIE